MADVDINSLMSCSRIPIRALFALINAQEGEGSRLSRRLYPRTHDKGVAGVQPLQQAPCSQITTSRGSKAFPPNGACNSGNPRRVSDRNSCTVTGPSARSHAVQCAYVDAEIQLSRLVAIRRADATCVDQVLS